MPKTVTFLLGFLLGCYLSWGQTNDSIVKYDTNISLEQRNFEKDLQEKYTGDEFDYTITTGESQNLLTRFLAFFFNWLADTFGFTISPEAFKILEIIIYILLGGLVLYLIIKFAVNEKVSTLLTKRAKPLTDLGISEQHIETIDFDALLADALKNKDYRLAVRYQFLLLLKHLSNKDLIDWHFEKTNADYTREIKEPRLKNSFMELAYLYDYVWYGEQAISEPAYLTAANKFNTVKNQTPSNHG
ncbi:hypothetical protein BUL40_08855 [Croceivirga radicis]|uniref:Protein-glutamine gamma-glutamyltransferase-like C-terminal domain-containing protein n=1 Tax=Croceivirga radicis TaxID=1929488 RepID=A0A1V6LR56_9FLAO|nr:DUF4129 domain-containing protein [Croceivirga radicis]OQD42628.1 hypothetical protein BUL40_08855 [Croceivirga radicis]